MRITPRERYLCALQKAQPDRLPATTMSWMAYHLKTYLGGIDILDAYRMFGLEGCIDVEVHLPAENSNWRVDQRIIQKGDSTRIEVSVTTPEGKLHWVLERNPYTEWLVEPPIKELDQIRLIDRFYPAPRIDVEKVRQMKSLVGEDGVLQGFPSGWRQPGPWQDACEWVGTQRMIMETIDHPDWTHEFMEILTRKRLATIESMQGAPYDVMLTGGGAASSTVISPRLHKEFCLPYDRRIHDALRTLGYKISYHTCGGMMPILEIIASNGCDCMEPFAPPGIGGDADLREAKRRVGQQVCMKGGFDQYNVLERGSPDEIREAVHRAFEEAGARGGFILCTSDHFYDVPVDNLWAYANAAKECVYR
jgi:uroporphyrinogen-III decarboxylase